jgi:glycosyltransferase involved in cell wall biosynthesis
VLDRPAAAAAAPRAPIVHAVRVHLVDPSAFTPPYDHALAAALAAAGADVDLFTSRFAYGEVAPAQGYERRELFYRLAAHVRGAHARRAVKLAEHVPDMLRYRRAARTAEVVHFQWLTVQHLDGHLLPPRRRPDGARRPLVLTAHDILPREPRRGQRTAQRRLYDRFDAIVVHSQHGRERLTGELGIDGDRVHVIEHGVFTHLDEEPAGAAQALPEAPDGRPVVLMFGLLRPYKGVADLLAAWRGIDGAELWIAGMPRMDLAPLLAAAPPGVRLFPRYVPERELAAMFRRADLVVLPYREIDQSGVLFTALAFARPLLLSDAGGFPEVAASGAARTFPAGDVAALRGALAELLGDPQARARLASAAGELAAGRHSWTSIGARTLALYEELIGV